MRVVKLCMLFVAMMPLQGPGCEVFQVTDSIEGKINNAWERGCRVLTWATCCKPQEELKSARQGKGENLSCTIGVRNAVELK